MRLARNFLAGLTGSAWNAAVTLASVPFVLHFVGMEAYGLVGFFAFAQSMLQLLDLGLAPTINREVARALTRDDRRGAGELLHTLAAIYWCAGLLILTIFLAAAPAIARGWLNPEGLEVDTVIHAVMLIGSVIAARWPLAVYQGALLGAERMVITARVSMAMTTLANVGGVVMLATVSASIEVYFLWQAVTGLLFSLIMRHFAWREIGRKSRTRFRWERIRAVWRFTAGMSLVAVTATVLMQVDKAILSAVLTLEDFGNYMLAALVASALYVILRPLFNTIYPRMSALVARDADAELLEFYLLGTRVMCAALFPLALAVALFAEELMLLWTRDAAVAAQVAPLVTLFTIGTALNGVMHFPYALQLAAGAARMPLEINLWLIALCVPMTLLLALEFGAFGGALSWVLLNSFYLCFGCFVTHRRLLVGHGLKWLGGSVLLPLLTSLTTIGAGWLLIMRFELSAPAALVAATLTAAAAAGGNLLLTQELVPRLRKALA